jgi:hypothetical protein
MLLKEAKEKSEAKQWITYRKEKEMFFHYF